MDLVQKLLLAPMPTLQEMAVLKIITTLYPDRLEEDDEDENDDIADYLEKSREKLDENILCLGSLPASIREQLHTRADSIYKEIRQWTSNLADDGGFFEIFHDLDCKLGKACMLHCIWKQNGKIDEKKTAQNLCKRSNLTADEKFAFMCKYCLKDEIDGISVDSLSPRLVDLADSVQILLQYWICYKKNELHEIPFGDTDARSLDEFMLNQHVVWETWASAEYFLDRLSPEDQVSVVQELIFNKGIEFDYLKNVWAKMSHGQRSEILSAIPGDVVMIFWGEAFEFELAYAIWMQIRGFITNKQFSEVIRVLLMKTPSSVDNVIALLSIDIWNSAADRLKNYVLRNDMMSDIFHGIRTRLNVNLLLAMLKHASENYRKNFIGMYGNLLTRDEDEEDEDRSVVEEIFSLCLSKNLE